MTLILISRHEYVLRVSKWTTETRDEDGKIANGKEFKILLQSNFINLYIHFLTNIKIIIIIIEFEIIFFVLYDL